jgi:hypothetical protein
MNSKKLLGAMLITACLLPCYSWAALGGDAASVLSDQSVLQAGFRSTVAAGYTVDELSLTSGTLIREYIGPTGMVFGVAWQGPVMPDLQQILGTYFNRYVSSAQKHVGMGPLVISEPDFFAQSGGRMRSFAGMACLPLFLPHGVTTSAIK